jgi:hypothetical protein
MNDHIDRALLVLTNSARQCQLLSVVSYEKLQESYRYYLAAHHGFEAAVAQQLSKLAQPSNNPWVKTSAGWAVDASELHLKPGVSPNASAFVMPPGFPARVPWDRCSDHGETYWVYTTPTSTLTIYND